MPPLTVRSISGAIDRALRIRVAKQGCIENAEIRAIGDEAGSPKIGLGTLLQQIGRAFGGDDLDFSRDKSPARAVEFE